MVTCLLLISFTRERQHTITTVAAIKTYYTVCFVKEEWIATLARISSMQCSGQDIVRKVR